ncbi:hypothetical protein [Actinocorallia aurantiaca]|uniref:Uncharacterized protein n=1 Tax=Actinocorallia aurantiaca TaxID=46204 RepID=A0ABN3UP97_9ACTN
MGTVPADLHVQIATSMDGRIAAIGPTPVHGARHDAHAFEASGLEEISGFHSMADLGCIGIEGIGLVPIERLPKAELRALFVQAVATLKGRMLGQEGGRYRAQINKWEDILDAITGLLFSRAYE